ncbi:MAG TPA: DUF4390 domain-containing protein [Nitrospiria bacterium]
MTAEIPRRILTGVLAAALAWGAVPPARAAEERIANLSETQINNGELTVSAELIRWTHERILTDINNGIPKDLFYYILLKKRQAGWYDEEVASKTVKHTIQYDVLKKQYTVTTRINDRVTTKTVDSFKEMAGLISHLDRVRITTERRLKARHTYYVSVKAEMRASRVPFYREYIFFFIPALELDTPWADTAPFYALEAPP